jgi:cytochrome c-type biogenesis protein CcsB
MSTIPFQWELTLLLIAIPIYILAMALAIARNLPGVMSVKNIQSTGYQTEDSKISFAYLSQGMLLSGFLLHTFALFLRGTRSGHVPLTNIYESFLFFSWSIMLVTLGISIVKKVSLVSIGTIPLALILMGIALFNFKDIEPLAPNLQTYWLIIHAGFSFLSYTAYALAFIAGILYLFQERQIKLKKFGFISRFLPPLESLDHLNYMSIFLGFILLTIGIITGAIWSKQVHQIYWQGNPKEILSVLTWVLYAIILQIRMISRWRGRKVAYLSILCFGFVIFTWLFIFQKVAIKL